MILAIESAIAQRLRAALAPLAVELMPSESFRFPYAKGGAVVMATEVSAGGVEDVGSSVQGAAVTVEVALMSRSVRDGRGVWDLFEAARKALLSFRPVHGASPLRLLDARLDTQDEGVWLLATRWQTLIPLAPDLEYEGGPLLTTVTFEEE